MSAVIRPIARRNSKGQRVVEARPKRVRDAVELLDVERIVAHDDHECAYSACPMQRVIRVGTEYVAVSDRTRLRPMSGRMIPAPPSRYHYECLPPRARLAADLLARPDDRAECRCEIVSFTRDPYEPHLPAQAEWEQADDCPVHPR